MKRWMIALSTIGIFAAATSAQERTNWVAEPQQNNSQAEALAKARAEGMMAAGFSQEPDGVVISGNPVKGAPFTATETSESSGTLRDGTHIDRATSTQIARDSEGRTRRETENMILIVDPVAGVSYQLNKRAHIAAKNDLNMKVMFNGQVLEFDAMPREATAEMKAKIAQDLKKAQENEALGEAGRGIITRDNGIAVTASNTSEPVEEDLGAQTMEGLSVTGKRITRTFQPNAAMGNDQPIKVVTEMWYSADLQMNILRHTDDPRLITTSTVKYTNVKRGEPDASLFQVPAGYTVNSRR